MLRITTVKTDRKLHLVLEGRLGSPWVTELIKEWNEVRASAGDLRVVVDLRNVTMISEEAAEHILIEMMSEAARFVCRGILNRFVIRRLERKLCEQRRRGTLS
jgi:hypothetical protein